MQGLTINRTNKIKSPLCFYLASLHRNMNIIFDIANSPNPSFGYFGRVSTVV